METKVKRQEKRTVSYIHYTDEYNPACRPLCQCICTNLKSGAYKDRPEDVLKILIYSIWSLENSCLFMWYILSTLWRCLLFLLLVDLLGWQKNHHLKFPPFHQTQYPCPVREFRKVGKCSCYIGG